MALKIRAKKTKALLAAITTTAALVFAGVTTAPSPAEASSSCNILGSCWWGITYTYDVFFSPGINECAPWVSPSNNSGQGCYQHNGDKFYVQDNAQNGMRVGVEWKIGDGRWGMCVNESGDGADNGGKCDYSFGDASQGDKIVYRMGECDGTVNSCGKPGTGAGWVHWGAYSEAKI